MNRLLTRLSPRYTKEQEAKREAMRSRLNVASILAETRVFVGLTQAELGRAAGTSQARVSELEGFRGNPRFDTLDRVAAKLGLMVTLAPRHGGSLIKDYGAPVTHEIGLATAATAPALPFGSYGEGVRLYG